MPPVNAPNLSVMPTNGGGLELPPLPVADIEKLDYLLARMKEKQTEFVDLYSLCREKWGDNRLLYLYFSEYFKKNNFTAVQTSQTHTQYVWQHRITSRGLSMESFRQEYIRQNGVGKNDTLYYESITYFIVHYLFPFSIIVAF